MGHTNINQEGDLLIPGESCPKFSVGCNFL